MLHAIAALLSIVLFFGGIIALINPRWVKARNRKQAVLAIILSFVLAAFSAPRSGQETATTGRQAGPAGAPQAAETRPVSQGYGSLSIHDVSVRDGQVAVSGATDLPDGAELVVSLQKVEAPRFRAEASTVVTAGRYAVAFGFPDRPDLADATFEVSVAFYPQRQSEAIKAAVGESGQQLTGQLVMEGILGRYLNVSRQETLRLPVRTDYTYVSPDQYETGSPEHVLASFLASWKEHDFDRMAGLTLNSWRQREADPPSVLAASYDFKYPFEARDLKVSSVSDVRAELEATVSYTSTLRSAPTTVRITALLFKEDASGAANPQGRWLVSPVSIREEELN